VTGFDILRPSEQLFSGHLVGKNKAFRVLFFAVTAAFPLACTPVPSVVSEQPNIILISLDTLRADRLGSYGCELPTSPAIDAFAEGSVVFDQAIAQSSHTSASHLAIFQSRYPSATEESAPHLAEIFKGAGYFTWAITGGGKISAKSRFNFDRGFEGYEEYPKGFRVSADIIEAWLQQPPRRPFFLFLHTYDIHAPYSNGAMYDTMYFPDYEGDVNPNRTQDYLNQLLGNTPVSERDSSITWNEADRRKLRALYNGGVRATDDYMERLFDAIGSSPSWNWDRDILVILSDHGEEFWEHGSVAHGHTLYQELIRVPLIVRFPGSLHAGTRIGTMVRLMDVGPTLLEMADIDKPESFWGRSLLPLLADAEEPMEPVNAISQTSGVKAIISLPWKLILYPKEGRTLLFNLVEDPKELHSVEADHPELVTQLKEMLKMTARNEDVPDLYVDEADIDDPALLEQLKALGYVD